ncbi:hypothetical protein BKP64_08640 [Marinobacter salinus]|uniref:Uncharacterized protein n=1 Tax=Marinobacter salinus TaxID=1874317 RepID=A0A1D9GKQ0_9GAMM|nr:hypothetical protein [Marinobacter salinus]AOY88226.1 hypothetical protein BKP64_08640 [Marinobacter salinus]
MDDWQGCLAPECQTALVRAGENVDRRGGSVITTEDFLLSLLDTCPSITRFLRVRGVDMDELVRTIQCEQPIVTEVGGEGLLSSQLIYWLAAARQVCDAPWLDWPVLLEVLTHKAERLQGKAYVAVLELVPDWAVGGDEGNGGEAKSHARAPIVITDADWLELAEDVAVTMSALVDSFVWVRGERGIGKSSWLQCFLSSLDLDVVELDLRREAEVMTSEWPAVPSDEERRRWPVMVLDNTSPADLLALMQRPGSVSAQLVGGWEGGLLLLGPDNNTGEERILEHWLGRSLEVFDMPGSSQVQRKAILVAHQAAIEKQWNIELPLSVIHYAATRRSHCVSMPGGILQWVERAAARLDLFARCGSAESLALAGQADTVRRQSLVAMARNEDVGAPGSGLDDLHLRKAAAEVLWHERKSAGTLRRLSSEDLRWELERWVAARPGPVHYVLHCDNQDGDSAGAGSGNLHS